MWGDNSSQGRLRDEGGLLFKRILLPNKASPREGRKKEKKCDRAEIKDAEKSGDLEFISSYASSTHFPPLNTLLPSSSPMSCSTRLSWVCVEVEVDDGNENSSGTRSSL